MYAIRSYYEPIWAIGTGETATSQQAEDMHAAIRSWISEKYDSNVAEKVAILYGGNPREHIYHPMLFAA